MSDRPPESEIPEPVVDMADSGVHGPTLPTPEPALPASVEHSDRPRLEQLRAALESTIESVEEPGRRQYVLDMALAAVTHEYARAYLPGWLVTLVSWTLGRLGASG